MRHNQKGFTLTELMVTLVISSIVLVAVVNFFISGVGHNKRYEESRNNREVINVISDLMYRDIMEADLSKACEPDNKNMPLRRCASISSFSKGNSSGAYCTSSKMTLDG